MPLRAARPEDVPALAALSAELGYPVGADALSDRLMALSRHGDHCVLVACDDRGGVVGWIHAGEQLLLDTGRRCEIFGLVVSEANRRQGIGQRLLDGAEEWARTRGLSELSVRSNIVRRSSHPFYEKHGFVHVKTQ